jgi:ribosomal protein S12 methylthiotransferase
LKTKNKKNNINIITLGCSKNLVDSEVLYTQLKGNDLSVTHQQEKDKSNIIVINTCGFIDRAKEESINTILEYAERKEAGKIEKLYVTGCLSHRYAEELNSEIPNIDGWFGTMDMPALVNRLGADYKKELLGERLITTDAHYAFLKIAEGCDRPCSFCAIPLMRGGHVSRSIEYLVSEATFLVNRGVKELILIAQDLTYYGLDLYGKRRLSDLLNALADISGLEWIRLQYAYPSGFPMDILDTMKERSNICNYLDMPIQHISDAMLKSMRRGITKEKTIRLIEDIREKVPGIALRTTLITGYPGETESDYEELVQFVADTKFDRLGVFTYSHEEKTHAYNLTDNVPEEIKEERKKYLMEIQQGISREINDQKIGMEIKVLFDRKEGDYWIGRTEHDSPEVDNEVLVKTELNENLTGQFKYVKITAAEDYDLFGSLI